LLQLTNTKGAIQVKTMRKPTRKIVVTTAASLLVLASLGVSAYAASNMDTIKKNQLMTETSSDVSTTAGTFTADGSALQDTETVQVDGPVTEAQAIEIGRQALSRMFGVDVSNLKQDALYLDNDQIKGTVYASPVWQLNWMSTIPNDEAVGEFESHTVTLDAATGEIVNIITDGVGGLDQQIQDISEESAKSLVRDFIEKNGLAKGTYIEEINMHNFYKKALLAKLKLANGKVATVVVSTLTGAVIGYEGDVEESAYPAIIIIEPMNKD
jgi:predicted small secreted protein